MQPAFNTLNELEITDHVRDRYNELLFQLKNRNCGITKEQLADVKGREASELLLFMFIDDEIAGTAQLSFISTPSRYTGYINGVVVDEKYRGHGLGSVLMLELERRAKERWNHLEKFSLTSSPERGTLGFYQRLGYHVRSKETGDETNIFLKDA
jgi:GNAT superfamily N-acetyltransferase